MQIEDMVEKIKNKNKNIDSNTLKYFSNYFWVLANNKDISQNLDIDRLIDNVLKHIKKVEFYNENSKIYKELGPDCKGAHMPKYETIYVRENLEEPLREITLYHELHHAVQANPKTTRSGISQEENFGRMIMEAQTQYFAEKVYKEIHNVNFAEKEIPSEQLRMLKGGRIISNLHNYEMYDSVLSKLSILFNMTKDFFVHANYLYNDNDGIKLLKDKYDENMKKFKYPYSFEDLMFRIDYIYCTDLLVYIENPDKEVVLSGKETSGKYTVHENKSSTVSLKKQFEYMNDFDKKYFLSLFLNEGDYKSFYKYICSDDIRNMFESYTKTDDKKKHL